MKDSYPYSNPKLWPFWSLIVLSILILVSCLFNQYRAIFLYWAPYHVISCIHAWHSIKHIKTLCCVVIFIAPGSYNLFMHRKVAKWRKEKGKGIISNFVKVAEFASSWTVIWSTHMMVKVWWLIVKFYNDQKMPKNMKIWHILRLNGNIFCGI